MLMFAPTPDHPSTLSHNVKEVLARTPRDTTRLRLPSTRSMLVLLVSVTAQTAVLRTQHRAIIAAFLTLPHTQPNSALLGHIRTHNGFFGWSYHVGFSGGALNAHCGGIRIHIQQIARRPPNCTLRQTRFLFPFSFYFLKVQQYATRQLISRPINECASETFFSLCKKFWGINPPLTRKYAILRNPAPIQNLKPPTFLNAYTIVDTMA